MKLIKCAWLGVAVVLLSQASCGSDPEPVVTPDAISINEVFSNGAGDDWIELYNSSSEIRDISGYYLYDDAANKYQIPLGISIAAKGFLVFFCNDLATGLNTNFRLSSAGESISLENASRKLIDKVDFPAMTNGQSFGRFPDGGTNLAVTGSPTPGASNGDTSAPAFTEVVRTPLVPGIDDAVSVQAQLVSTAGITEVTLYYSIGGGAFTGVSMTLGGSYYTGTIPAAGVTGKVRYYVTASNSAGKSSSKPVDAPADTYSYLINTDPLPQLLINEFMATNTSCCPDNSSGLDEFDDWIEIYNAGPEAVDIGDMYLSDSKGNPFQFHVPDDAPVATTIQPGGYLVLWADEDGSQGPLHMNFRLDGAGEDVALFYIDGRIIDSYTFGAQTENVSWGRTPNGGVDWKSYAVPTPGAQN